MIRIYSSRNIEVLQKLRIPNEKRTENESEGDLTNSTSLLNISINIQYIQNNLEILCLTMNFVELLAFVIYFKTNAAIAPLHIKFSK